MAAVEYLSSIGRGARFNTRARVNILLEHEYSCHKMEIESEELLFTYLQEELAWRKKELTHIKFLIDSAHKNELDFNLRIGITFLYAHWEGFIKESTAYYINFLRNQNYTYGQLTDCFIGWTLKPKIKQCSNSEKFLFIPKLLIFL